MVSRQHLPRTGKLDIDSNLVYCMTKLPFFPQTVYTRRCCRTRRGNLHKHFHPKSFIWSFNPQNIAIIHNEKKVRNIGYGNRTCLDAQGGKKGLRKPVILYNCHRQGGNQVNIFFHIEERCCLVAKIIFLFLYNFFFVFFRKFSSWCLFLRCRFPFFHLPPFFL